MDSKINKTYLQIWDMSDPQGKGHLDKSGLFMAIKLITLAQTGKDVTMSNAIQNYDDLPEISGDKPIIRPPSVPPMAQNMPHMEIAEEMLAAYQKMFQTVAEPGPAGQPMCVPGNKVCLLIMVMIANNIRLWLRLRRWMY